MAKKITDTQRRNAWVKGMDRINDSLAKIAIGKIDGFGKRLHKQLPLPRSELKYQDKNFDRAKGLLYIADFFEKKAEPVFKEAGFTIMRYQEEPIIRRKRK